jgi:hypothetical protein
MPLSATNYTGLTLHKQLIFDDSKELTVREFRLEQHLLQSTTKLKHTHKEEILSI